MRETMNAMTTPSTTTVTTTIHDRRKLSARAMTIPPSAMSGAMTSIVALSTMNCWTCRMSLVLRVMRPAAEKRETSWWPMSTTWWKTSRRRSRAADIAHFAPQ